MIKPDALSAGKSLIRIDLQHFASDDGKTEKATPKRKQDARKKGQVLQSRELAAAVTLISTFIGLNVFGNDIYHEISDFFIRVFEEYPKMDDLFTINELLKFFYDALLVLLKTTGPIFAIALIAGLFTGYAQVGFIFTMDTLGFKLNKLNPISGFKRMFSVNAVFELIKSILKIAVVSYIAYSYLKGQERSVVNLMNMSILNSAIFIASTAINVGIRMCIALIVLGVLDYIFQWWQYEKSLRMSKQEIKEEYKQLEGNPEIKSKIKQKQRQISMRRMMQEVPKADVVITNPTHFAIAVKYDPDVSDAPMVVAKGQDYMAMRIKEVAKESNIEIVENKQLARTLYKSVEIGEAIPPELYQAVAEVLAFVYSLKSRDKTG